MSKVSIRLVFVFLLLICASLVYAGPPVFILGLYGGPEIVSEDLLPAELQMQGKLEASFGWRGRVFEGGYFSIISQAAGTVMSGWTFEDQEFLQADMSLPAGPGRVDMSAGLYSSVLGTDELPGFINPDWGLLYRLNLGSNKTEGRIEYSGYSLVEPNDLGDIIYQGARLAFSHSFSLRYNLSFSAGFGYEGWYETNLYSNDGSLTDENREDFLVDGKIVFEGLAGYFTEWTVPVRCLWRNSTANTYLSTGIFIPDSNSRIQLSTAPEINFSPHRTLNIDLHTSIEHYAYLERLAFDENGFQAAENLQITSFGGGFSLDWTINHRLYLVLRSDAGYTWSNDPFETGWYCNVYGGVELSF